MFSALFTFSRQSLVFQVQREEFLQRDQKVMYDIIHFIGCQHDERHRTKGDSLHIELPLISLRHLKRAMK